jgi:ribosomal protein S18 acetylase RimI-like enzyme
MSKEIRQHIDSFRKFSLLVESLNNISVVEYKPIGYVKGYKGYKLLSNDIQLAYMVGLKDGDRFFLSGIKVENEFRGKNLGEFLIMEYLKKYGGQVISNSKGRRSTDAEKMWERISKRNDVNIEIKKGDYPFPPFYLNHYWVSLK